MYHLKVNNTAYTIRTERLNSVEHLVVPVIMIREGVHSGSAGAIYHRATELARCTEAWNGVPVTIGHPRDTEGYVSANAPSVLESWAVGRVFNTHMQGDKLAAEAWVEVSRISSLSARTLEMINNGEALDVSVGVFSDDIAEAGNWNGEDYTKIATNYRPDHLALLPYETGACSFEDGCGVRANSSQTQKNANNVKMKISNFKAAMLEEMPLQVNKDFTQIASDIQRMLDRMDTDNSYHFLEELYEAEFYYRVSASRRPAMFYRQAYTVNDNDEIEFVDSPVKVKRTIQWDELQVNSTEEPMRRTAPIRKQIKNNSQMKKEEKIAKLVANANSGFCDCAEDQAYLSTLSDEKLDAFIAKLPAEQPVQTNATAPAAKSEEKKATTLQDYMAGMPEELREQFAHGMKAYNAQKAGLVAKIKGYAQNQWTEQELNVMSVDALDRIPKMIPETAPEQPQFHDYSLNGARTVIQTNDDGGEVLLPTGYGKTEKK